MMRMRVYVMEVRVMRVRVRMKEAMVRKMGRQGWGSYRGDRNGKYKGGENIRMEEENIGTYSPHLLPPYSPFLYSSSCSPYPFSPFICSPS